MKLIFFLFLFTCFRTDAQEVKFILTNLKKEEKIEYLNFQGESYFDIPDTISVMLKEEYSNVGILIVKTENGYVLCDFSNFYGQIKSKFEPIEFNFFKLKEAEYRTTVYTMSGAEVFWDSRFLSEINMVTGKTKSKK